MEKSNKEKLLTIEAAAELFSVSPQLLYREMKTGRLQFKKIGKLRRVTEDALKKWLQNQQKPEGIK